MLSFGMKLQFLFINSLVTSAVADAVSILGEYMKDEPWLKLLCDHLKYSLLTSPILLIDTLLHITMFLYEFRKYSNHTTFG